MKMSDMIRETISEFCLEKEIDIEWEEIDELLDAIGACFEYASYSVATPSSDSEIKRLEKELEIERSKVPCSSCMGSGTEVSHGPFHSSYRRCSTCRGEGKILP